MSGEADHCLFFLMIEQVHECDSYFMFLGDEYCMFNDCYMFNRREPNKSGSLGSEHLRGWCKKRGKLGRLLEKAG